MTDPLVKLAVIGSWHQSAVVSACLADSGHQVTGIADDATRAAELNAGRAPLFEPCLDDLIRRNVDAGGLAYTTSYAEGLSGVDIAFLCIDTPVGPGDESDLSSIDDAVEQIATHASGQFVLCVSAQVPIGTCDRISQTLDQRAGWSIPVVCVPEFLRLGTAIQTFREADRFVIGSDDPDAAAQVVRLYAPLGRPIYVSGRRSAEMGKHASNAFLATSISFINQIADLCEETGADVTEVAAIMKLDARIGQKAFLSAGMGFAGGTLGREIRALQHLGERCGIPTDLLDSVASTNGRRVPRMLERIREAVSPLVGARICVFGLTYKPGTSTLRRSAALELIDGLVADGASVAAFDPLARLEEGEAGFGVGDDPQAAAADASALVLMAPWAGMPQFDLAACARTMRRAVLFDTGNYLSPATARAAGFEYFGVGREAVKGRR